MVLRVLCYIALRCILLLCMAGVAVFYFDRVMDCSATVLPNIILQFSAFIGTSLLFYRMDNSFTAKCGSGVPTANSVTLNSGTETTVTRTNTFSKSIKIVFGYNNVQILKSYATLLKSAATTHARFDTGAFYDTFGNPSAFIFDGIALPVNVYVTNTNRPRLISFTVSNQQQMSLFFTEPIDATKIIVSQILVQDAKRNPVNTFFLSASRVFFISTLRTQIRLSLLTDFARITLISSKSLFHRLPFFLSFTSFIYVYHSFDRLIMSALLCCVFCGLMKTYSSSSSPRIWVPRPSRRSTCSATSWCRCSARTHS